MSLPEPDDFAKAHSGRLAALLRSRIHDCGGFISFAEYMALALYAPGLGYYAAGAHKLGHGGDFVTAPELSPLFGRALATQIEQVLRLGAADCLELGPGSGRLAYDILLALAERDCLPQHYWLLETSPDLRQRQQDTLAKLPEELRARCAWLDRLPARMDGCIFGNEVLDALPFEIVQREGERAVQSGITVDATGQFQWSERLLEKGALREAVLARLPDDGAIREVNLQAEALVISLGKVLQRGMLWFLDYGYPAAEFYHPQRRGGTLRCFYRHQAHENPLLWPGLQDITAHIDFSAMALAAAETDLDFVGFTSQAQFLINCGILKELSATGEPGGVSYLKAANALNRLLHPAEMGEIIKVIAWTKRLAPIPLGFAAGNKLHRL